MKTSIVWFKTDLRVNDNETLSTAIFKSDLIIPVFCFDETHFQKNEFGFIKTGARRTQFLIESLIGLQSNLKALGSNLYIVRGKPEVELAKIAAHFQADHVFAKKEVAQEELDTQLRVEKELWKQKCELEVFSTSTLYHPSDLPFSINNIPDLFTEFRNKVEKEATIRAIIQKPLQINSPKFSNTFIFNLKQLGFEDFTMDKRTSFPFKGGENEALKRLNYYFFESELVSNYKTTRNGLSGVDFSSKFSPWLSLGCISPREIYHELKKYETVKGANESTYWLYFELLWRDFFRFMMKKHKEKLFSFSGISNKKKQPPALDQNLFDKWKSGNTGVDFIDAAMRELNLTGYMSNRMRQNVASYFCNDLKLDWRYGAAYFEQQLIDYDECSNWGNWAYLAGVGNDNRKDRYFNTSKQATTYDKDGKYRKMWMENN